MKSKDTATKRKDMRRYTSHVRDMDQSILDRQHYLEEKAKKTVQVNKVKIINLIVLFINLL